MIRKRMIGDLNIAYRPYRVDEMFGNTRIKSMLSGFLNNKTLPHASLFVGPPGCGKTTAARIVALGLNCEIGVTPNPCCECSACKAIIHQNSMSVLELDGARVGNVDTIRHALNDLPSAPFGTDRVRVLIIDEAHKMSGAAEDALLKFLEDTPPHVYVILCTNEPQKLKEVTLQRCKQIQFSRLDSESLFNLLEQVSQFEGIPYKKDILNKIVEECEGTPRVALSFLQQISAEGSWTDEAASFILSAGVDIDQREVVELCRLLIKRGSTWKSIQYLFLDLIKKVPAEPMRIALVGFLSGCFRNTQSMEEAIIYARCVDTMKTLYYGPKPEHVLFLNIFKCYHLIQKTGQAEVLFK